MTEAAKQEASTEPARRRVGLVVGAHPDDPDFGAGGTAALWSRDGWDFYYLVCTNGSKGSADPTMDPVALVEYRATSSEPRRGNWASRVLLPRRC